ncbi:MAG: sulfatase [Planctomyces sp.]
MKSRWISVCLPVWLCCCWFSGSANAEESQAGSASRPNVLLILSDDQAWTDYGFMGHPTIRTPHLDRLAGSAALFRRGYTPTPLCRPSLMSILTGRYAHEHGVVGNDPRPDKSLSDQDYAALREQLISRVDRVPTLPRLLSSAGYACLQTGKWWEGSWKRGGFTAGMTRGFPEQGGRHGDDGLKIGRQGVTPILEFMDRSVAGKQPFFIWYAPMLPHTPHNPPARLLQKYEQPGVAPELAKYHAMCEWFDETCGELLTALDARGLTENTLVVYVTDNGWIQATAQMRLGPGWTHGFAPRSKQSVYEGGVRTPVMFRWPGRIPAADRPELATTLDVLPTVLAAAGVAAPEGLPGLNLLPALTSGGKLERDWVSGEGYSHDIADLSDPESSLVTRWCIEGEWKLILTWEPPQDRYAFVHSLNERRPQLYRVTEDPAEQVNLASQHPELVSRLRERLQREWTVVRRPIE